MTAETLNLGDGSHLASLSCNYNPDDELFCSKNNSHLLSSKLMTTRDDWGEEMTLEVHGKIVEDERKRYWHGENWYNSTESIEKNDLSLPEKPNAIIANETEVINLFLKKIWSLKSDN
jgi:hypothetical protein